MCQRQLAEKDGKTALRVCLVDTPHSVQLHYIPGGLSLQGDFLSGKALRAARLCVSQVAIVTDRSDMATLGCHIGNFVIIDNIQVFCYTKYSQNVNRNTVPIVKRSDICGSGY